MSLRQVSFIRHKNLRGPMMLRTPAGNHLWRIVCGTALALALSACNQQNAYVPPPPPKVDVALPLKQDVTPYLMATGNTAPVNETTLVARVVGFLQAINYKDGDGVKAGTQLFV